MRIVTVIKRGGREPKWFFPCFFIYICTMIPPIWFVELTRIEIANDKRRPLNSSGVGSELEFENLIGHSDLNDTLMVSFFSDNIQQKKSVIIALKFIKRNSTWI